MHICYFPVEAEPLYSLLLLSVSYFLVELLSLFGNKYDYSLLFKRNHSLVGELNLQRRFHMILIRAL